MMQRLLVRDARPDDHDAIREVTLAAYQEYAVQLAPHWESYQQDIVATLADVQPVAQFVGELDGAIVGSILLYPAGLVFSSPDGLTVTLRWPEVRLLAVAPTARGHGVGEALVRACIQRAREWGAAVLMLHTTDLMQAAMRLYVRMGFVRAPEYDFSPAPDLVIKGYTLDLTADGGR
jgi:GNAT superfamily N-acetyltransferase